MKRFCGYKKDGSQLMLSDAEIIENALNQEKDGIKPHYAFYDYIRLTRLFFYDIIKHEI